jgi:amino acid transporter
MLVHAGQQTVVTDDSSGSESQKDAVSTEKPAVQEEDIEHTATLDEHGHGSTVILDPGVDTAGYHRSLGRRQIMMMTFGAGIGTGLWVGTGQALKFGLSARTREACMYRLANHQPLSRSWRSCGHLYHHGVSIPPWLGWCFADDTPRFIVYAQYSSIGEMITYKPVHGGFIRQCAEYVDPAFGFAIGINFWFAVSNIDDVLLSARPRNVDVLLVFVSGL